MVKNESPLIKRHYGIRTERYKLIHFYYDIDAWELYYLKKDSQELNNVYNDPEYGQVTKELERKLRQLREKLGDCDALTEKHLKNYLQNNRELIETHWPEAL